MIQLKYLYNRVCKRVPYMQKHMVKRVVSITIRIMADEFAKDPYGCISRLNRYVNTLAQFDNPPTRKGYHNE